MKFFVGASKLADSNIGLNTSTLLGAPVYITVTGRDSSPLKFRVSGIRNILAVSAVTTGSASSPCCTHSAFNPSAKGFHSSLGRGLSSPQYTCTPRPELTNVGLGSSTAFINALTARIPSAWVGYGLPTPQSMSRKKDCSSTALIMVLPSLLSANVAKAKYASYPEVTIPSACSTTSSIELTKVCFGLPSFFKATKQ